LAEELLRGEDVESRRISASGSGGEESSRSARIGGKSSRRSARGSGDGESSRRSASGGDMKGAAGEVPAEYHEDDQF
jgi:hypothetical protein